MTLKTTKIIFALTLVFLLGHAGPATAAPDTDGFPTLDTSGLGSLSTAHFRILYEPQAEAGARSLAEDAEGHRAWIYDELGLDDERPIRLVVLGDLNQYFVRRGVSSRAPDWAIGLSLGREGTILVKWGRGKTGGWLNLEPTFVHELAHLSLDRATGVGSDHIHGAESEAATRGGERRVPRWLHEGFAIHQAGEWTLERSASLMRAGLTGQIMPLSDLREGFPRSGPAVELAYAESYHFLLTLFERFGRDKFRVFIAALRTKPFEEAFAAVYLTSFASVERDWREDLSVTYTWVPVVFGSTTMWFFVAILALWAYRRKRRQMLERMSHMDDGPPPLSDLVPLPGLGLTRDRIGGDGGGPRIVTFDPRPHQNDDETIPRSPDGHTLH